MVTITASYEKRLIVEMSQLGLIGFGMHNQTDIAETLRKKSEKKSFYQENIKPILVGASISLVYSLLSDWLVDHGIHPVHFIVGKISPHQAQSALAVSIIVCGISAHYFKRYSQYWYGFVEVVFGITSSVAIAFSMATVGLDLPRWASLIGAGYVIARGLNNMHDALKRA